MIESEVDTNNQAQAPKARELNTLSNPRTWTPKTRP
jgi:hypothetical protein